VKKSIPALAGLLAVSAALAACGGAEGASSGDAAAENGTVTIGFQKGNTVNILKARGNLDERLAEEGYEVEWAEFAVGTALLEALNTNQIDFGHASDANSVFSAAGGVPIEYVASESPYPAGVALVAKEGSGIDSVEDLVGKKVGVTQGGNQHYLLLRALEEAGLEPDAVEVVLYSSASDGLSAFQQGSFDVLGTWDPYLAIIEDTIPTTTVVNGEGLTENRTFYFASEELLGENSDVLKIILEELEESDQWANDNIDEVATILSDELGLDNAPLLTANERRTFGVQPVDEDVVASQQQLADTFEGIGLLENPITIADFVTENPSWLPETLAQK
jgi:sulfonate transport system substrate-binding protein